MPRPLGTHQALLEDKPLSRRYVERFGVMDFHTHFRWNAIQPYIDWNAVRTLEVGANTGVMTFELAEGMPRGHVVSSEFDVAQLARAQEIKSRTGASNITLGQADLRELALAGEEFDQALVIDVLEHIDDHETAVSQLAEALRPGGRLIVSVPTPNYPAVFGREFHDEIGHVRDGYWLEDLDDLLRGGGFAVRHAHYYTGRLASLGCSLYYRGAYGYGRLPGKVRLAATPLWRGLARMSERSVRRDHAASLALMAERV